MFRVNVLGLPWWSRSLESVCQCRGHGFNPWSRKIPHAAGQLSPCATTTDPVCSRARVLQQEKPPQGEACVLQLESSPHWPQLEKARAQQWRPSAAKNDKLITFKKNSKTSTITSCQQYQFRNSKYLNTYNDQSCQYYFKPSFSLTPPSFPLYPHHAHFTFRSLRGGCRVFGQRRRTRRAEESLLGWKNQAGFTSQPCTIDRYVELLLPWALSLRFLFVNNCKLT